MGEDSCSGFHTDSEAGIGWIALSSFHSRNRYLESEKALFLDFVILKKIDISGPLMLLSTGS